MTVAELPVKAEDASEATQPPGEDAWVKLALTSPATFDVKFVGPDGDEQVASLTKKQMVEMDADAYRRVTKALEGLKVAWESGVLIEATRQCAENIQKMTDQMVPPETVSFTVQYAGGSLPPQTGFEDTSREKVLALALEWVNALREEYEAQALAALPPGLAGDAQECVIARAMGDCGDGGVRVGRGELVLGLARHPHPPVVQEFIRRFDMGLYSELMV